MYIYIHIYRYCIYYIYVIYVIYTCWLLRNMTGGSTKVMTEKVQQPIIESTCPKCGTRHATTPVITCHAPPQVSVFVLLY